MIGRFAGTSKTAGKATAFAANHAVIALRSMNFSSSSLSRCLLAGFSGTKSVEVVISPNNPDARTQIFLRSPSVFALKDWARFVHQHPDRKASHS
jgi:hypothetical protein